MSDVVPTYPNSLTVASWNKVKGLLARMTGAKTGVTEQLQAAEKLFKAAPFDAVYDATDRNLAYQKGLEALKAYQQTFLRTYQPKFKALSTALVELSRFLEKQAKAFETDTKLSKFAAPLHLMAADANKFSYVVAWGTVSDVAQKELSAKILLLENRGKNVAELLKPAGPALDKCINKLKEYKSKPPTADEYVKLLPNYMRLPGTYINTASKSAPQVKVTFADYLKYSSTKWAGDGGFRGGEDMAKRIKEDLGVLKAAKLKWESL